MGRVGGRERRTRRVARCAACLPLPLSGLEPATSAPGTGEEGADELLEPIVKAEKKEEAASPSEAAEPPKETPKKRETKKRARQN